MLAAIRDHQVVIVAGETGSGKTTQLPKICLELGRGVAGADRAHPAAPDRRPHGRRADRRGAAAPSSASRSATRSASPTSVGARHAGQADDRRHPAGRDRSSDRLLRALRHDHHRRGARAQPQHRLPARLPHAAAAPPPRPEGDHHLGDDRPGAVRRALRRARPVPIEVSGRTYPVEVRYRPLVELPSTDDEDDRPASGDQIAGDLRRGRRAGAARARRHPGLPAPASGRSATPPTPCAAHGPAPAPRSCRSTPGCPPPSSTGCSSPHTGRRIVLATNVAETSLTVPGIRYVVDPGTARISRYSHAHQGAAAADRADLAGLGQPARGPLRPRRGRHLHPAVLRGGLRRPPGVHRPGDPADQPGLGHPADGRAAGSATSAGFPFVDPPDRAQHQRRRAAAGGARRAARRAAEAPAPAPAAPTLGRRAGAGCRSTRGWAG